MLIYVKSLKNYVNFMLIYAKLCEYHRQTDGQTDRQTHQKYSSEPHKKKVLWSKTTWHKTSIIMMFYFDLKMK